MKNKLKKPPMRRCCGCMESRPKGDMIRIVLTEGGLAADESGRAAGRGAYVCPKASCIKKAMAKGGINRSLHQQLEKKQVASFLEGLLDKIEDEEK